MMDLGPLSSSFWNIEYLKKKVTPPDKPSKFIFTCSINFDFCASRSVAICRSTLKCSVNAFGASY